MNNLNKETTDSLTEYLLEIKKQSLMKLFSHYGIKNDPKKSKLDMVNTLYDFMKENNINYNEVLELLDVKSVSSESDDKVHEGSINYRDKVFKELSDQARRMVIINVKPRDERDILSKKQIEFVSSCNNIINIARLVPFYIDVEVPYAIYVVMKEARIPNIFKETEKTPSVEGGNEQYFNIMPKYDITMFEKDDYLKYKLHSN